jgi:sortase (surface protein transpeptidase)
LKEYLMRGGRRGLVATVAGVVFAATGATAIAVAVAAQQHAPQPPLSAAGSRGPHATRAHRTNGTKPAGHSSSHKTGNVVGPVLPRSKPVRIDVPVIDVHSTLQYLGLTPEGTLMVPAPGPHYNEAGWYKYSPTPGSVGPAVIAGHIDSAAQGPSVFFNLGDLEPGDKIFISRVDGLVAVFKVDGVRRYPKVDFPTRLVYGKTHHAALRLITCGGPFDYATGHYTDNIVVFASLAGSHKQSGN